tara:strand:- start:619 stop:1344 length:726 start_codon:yes stop_codon:yes gene_type:complete
MQEKLHMTHHPGTDPPPFTTRIVGKDGNTLLLEETFCYPRGGGQPGDTGVITSIEGESCKMEEVLPGEMIIHPVDDATLFTVGQEVICTIDQNRRNALTLMHTAQHIFSAMSEDIWGAETVGNQIGVESSRVDLLFDDKDVFDSDIIIDKVNSILSSKIPVNVHEWDRETILSHENMRHTKFMHRVPESITHLRVVEIEDIDLCPCAGTHASNTSMIPRVKFISKKNKGRGRLRVSYSFDI